MHSYSLGKCKGGCVYATPKRGLDHRGGGGS